MYQAGIPGYEGLYQANTAGQIISVERLDFTGTRKLKSRVLRPTDNKGYKMLTLYKEAVPYTHMVHTLIAATFLAPSNVKIEVNHIDGIKDNNTLLNLERITKSGNIRHAYALGLKVGKTNMKGVTNEQNVKSKRVAQITFSGQLVNEWPSTQEVQRSLGFHSTNVGAAARGALKSAYGFNWKYVQ